jgi:extradiol dioxygenase
MNIVALGYLGFESPTAQAWETFGPEVFGLGLRDPGSDGTVYLRMDDRHHRIAIHPGSEDRLAYIGWEVRDNAAFDTSLVELRGKGVAFEIADDATAAQRQVSGMAWLTDPAGYVHEIFWGASFTVDSFLPGKPMKGFVAGPLGVGHVVVAVPKITPELERFATEILGFTLYAGAPVGMGKAGGPQPRFYRCSSRTHCFAYIGLPGMRGVQHVCLEARDLDDVGKAYDLVQERGIPITLSLGRHSMDRLVSFYMRGPSGFDLEFGAGGELLGPDFVMQSPSHSEVWGHKPVTKGWAPTVRKVETG